MAGMAPRTGMEGPMDLHLDIGVEEEEPCPECGAPVGQPHDPMCPFEDQGDPRDPDRAYDARVDRQVEGKEEMVEFDKFMDRIVIDEKQRQRIDRPENNPQRQRAAKYQDRPMNKTRWGGK